jgi:hypothetical protein
MGNNIGEINELKMDLEQLRRFHAIGYTGQYPDVVYRAIRHEQQRILDEINCLQDLWQAKGMVQNHPFCFTLF